MSNIVWDWQPDEFSPPFTVKYGEGLDLDEDGAPIPVGVASDAGVVSVMALAPTLYHQGGKWFVVSMYDVPQGQRRTAASTLKMLVEQRWHDHIQATNQLENQS